MTIWRIIGEEIGHRRLNFCLAVTAVAVAAGCVMGVVLLLRNHDLETARILAERHAQIEERGKELQDDMRKITKGLGFNVLILPADQNLADVYAEGYAEKTMPEEYVQRLAKVPSIKTIAHLLPALEQKVIWPEFRRTVIVAGIRGEVPFVSQKSKDQLQDPVTEGHMILGYELHHQLQLKTGDEVSFMETPYRIAKTYPQRGTKDDITLWIPLKDAQHLLHKEGMINAIWALNCNCYSMDMLAEVRDEIVQYLPDTQVIELSGKATARAEARKRAYQDAVAALEAEQTSREALRRQMESFGAVLVPIIVLGSAVWIGLLALSNARDRRTEIGILQAIGVKGGRVLAIFLGKALIVGAVGAMLGCLLGLGIAWGCSASGILRPAVRFIDLISGGLWQVVVIMLVSAPVLSATATWLPAQYAAQLDPASVLRKE